MRSCKITTKETRQNLHWKYVIRLLPYRDVLARSSVLSIAEKTFRKMVEWEQSANLLS